MKQSKITIIQDYLKKYQPSLISIINVKKKKNNFIVKCNIHFKSTIEVPFGTPFPTMDDPALTQFVSNITEQKTYIIPIKDIQFPTKRKLPKIKKIHLS
jgi:hypothetical protein